MEQRRFHRITYSAPGELVHHDIKYRCRLENVSLRGALISADECLMVPLHESCRLTVPLQPGGAPLTITVSVVHCFFSMIGVKFTGFSGDSEQRLFDLLKEKTTEPEKLLQEWDSLRKERADAGQEKTVIPEPALAIF
ncbi:PilZ domain-containing protein [Geomonas oryzisoli]|uniref:PilZ domain-containing protein n=1 Tax=Geomonas oryzisoli TaxID=2847992 RepID=A0ABX8J9B4_9BACT|nr:PilZ domain-containing protein [Geomonas oryzisoli]QWV94908.1 PilZ domain-containing protein [Geomonas oryzisoli]